MKYTFVSLGRLESIGVRLGGAGLGNILFPWACALVYAKEHNCKRIQTTWRNLKIGTFLRKEKDKRKEKKIKRGKKKKIKGTGETKVKRKKNTRRAARTRKTSPNL